jgi:hypothetical protein
MMPSSNISISISPCVSTSAIISPRHRVAWLFFPFDQCAIFHVCTKLGILNSIMMNYFFNCIYNVIYLRNSRFLQMIMGIGTSAPHNRCRNVQVIKHFSIILADTSAEILTERQASSTIFRCV